MMQNGEALRAIGGTWMLRRSTERARAWLALVAIVFITAQVFCLPIRATAEEEVPRTDAEMRDSSDAPDAAEEEAPGEPSAEPEEAGGRDGTEGIETIMVRGARSQLTSVDSPSSVVSFDSEDLTALGSSDISGLALFTPNLEIKAAFAASNPTLFIRGVGLKDYFSNAASAVAVYNDRIYMNSPTGQLFQMFDLEGVEILRGPQGTLFGRNATAGAIRVLPHRPSGDFGGFTSVAYGNKNLLELEGAVDAPIVPQVLSTRISARLNARDGIMENRCGDPVNAFGSACRLDGLRIPPLSLKNETNDVDNWAARGMFELEPMNSMTWMLNLNGGRNRSTATQFQSIGTSGGVLGSIDGSSFRDSDLPNGATSPLEGDPYAGDFNFTGDEDVDLFLASLDGKWNLGDVTLESITGFAMNERDTGQNADANPRVLIEIDWFNKAKQVSQELGATYDLSERFQLKAGAFYLTEKLEAENNFKFQQNQTIDQFLDQSTTVAALYGYGSYGFSDTVTLEGGLRYNWDKKHFRNRSGQTPLIPPRPTIPRFSDGDDETWSGVSGDLILRWEPVPLFMTYAKYTHGWKAGQYNGGTTQRANVVIEPVDPEAVDAFEIGFDRSLFSDRVSIGGAGFYYRYNDQQIFVLNTAGTLPAPTLLNANDSQVLGMEADLRLHPFPWIDLFTSVAYLDTEYLDFTRRTQDINLNTFPVQVVRLTADYSGNQLLNAPEYSVTGYGSVDIPLGRAGMIRPRLDYSYKSRVYFGPDEGRGQFLNFPKDTLSQEGFWLLNARLAYLTPDEKLEIAGFVRNLTNEEYLVDGFDTSRSFDNLLFVIGTPRLYGVSVRLSF